MSAPADPAHVAHAAAPGRAPLASAARRARSAAPWIALAAGVAFAVAFAATRNLYDDEVASFRLATQGYAELWREANTHDVHPPGQYALGRLFLGLAGSPRRAMLGPIALLYGSLALFVAALLREGELRGGARALFAAVAVLHPQVAMWGTSLRWQPAWTALALVSLVLALGLGRRRAAHPHDDDDDDDALVPTLPAQVGAGLALAGMLYLNYLTIPFAVALAVGVALRFGIAPARPRRLARLALPFAIAAFAFAPQLSPMWHVHMQATQAQVANRLMVLLKLVPGAVVGEPLLPWHPLAVVFGVATLPLLALLASALVRHARTRGLASGPQPAWVAIAGVYAALFALALATGLGRKPRSFVVLGPLFAYLFAFAWQRVRRGALRGAVVALVAAWIATSLAHLWLRVGTSKTGFNDHYEEVVAFARSTARGRPAVFFTHDPALAFALHEHARASDDPWVACSVAPDWYHGVDCAAARGVPPRFERVFLVTGYVGSFLAQRAQLAAAIDAVGHSIDVERRGELGRDRDAAMKRRLPGALAKLTPDYRFTVFEGPPRPGFALERRAADYQALAPPPGAAPVRGDE